MSKDYGGEDSIGDDVHRLIEARDYHRARQEAAEEAGSASAEIHAYNADRCQDLAEDGIRNAKSH
ncbi:hypothetical protein ABT390_33970 [Streptomyces aurantiacus]|uniref:Uncharacterized protein n=1 Tax=Streptomyces aurantiacus JA 4570 TaxID=1286094 RepID=S3ZVR9_9ACTN|nr:hypothetical protein [Streptomyces aurantiacus]EPH46874.1 hypothetical protein STRAU_0040 [Streptomyces aurantiacus JA 4570]